jgi:hypothetical protein
MSEEDAIAEAEEIFDLWEKNAMASLFDKNTLGARDLLIKLIAEAIFDAANGRLDE